MNKKITITTAAFALAIMTPGYAFEPGDIPSNNDHETTRAVLEVKAEFVQAVKDFFNKFKAHGSHAVEASADVATLAPTASVPAAATKVAEAPVDAQAVAPTVADARTRMLLTVEQLKRFVGAHRYELVGVVGIAVAGGVLYVVYKNGGRELLLDFVLDHPKIAATLVAGIVTTVAVGVIAYKKGYTAADLKLSLNNALPKNITLGKLPSLKLG